MDRTKLIAFYSRAGENYYSGDIRRVDEGNTKKVAQMIADLTGADMFEITQKVPYADDYYTCIEEAKKDLQAKARPELAAIPANLDAYKEIYLGYPIYWGNMPMAVYTFLESFDWNGKTIHPFCTHEGSGLGRTVDQISRTCPGAEVSRGLAIPGGSVDGARRDVGHWV